MDSLTLNSKINKLSPALLEEVNHYIDYLLEKAMKTKEKKNREFGIFKGKIIIASDFEAPLDEFKDYM